MDNPYFINPYDVPPTQEPRMLPVWLVVCMNSFFCLAGAGVVLLYFLLAH